MFKDIKGMSLVLSDANPLFKFGDYVAQETQFLCEKNGLHRAVALKNTDQLITNSFSRYFFKHRHIIGECLSSFCLDGEIQFCRDADSSEHTQSVFFESFVSFPYGNDETSFDIVFSPVLVKYCLGIRSIRDSVYREITTLEIVGEIVAELYFIRMSCVRVFPFYPIWGHFHDLETRVPGLCHYSHRTEI